MIPFSILSGQLLAEGNSIQEISILDVSRIGFPFRVPKSFHKSWVPFVGDVIAIALGFYRTRPWATMFLLLVGKLLRFLCWNLIYGLI